jgi:hypothetical protein
MQFYATREIKKKNWNSRTIRIPSEKLREIQKDILEILTVKNLNIKTCFYSYRKWYSTFDNAQAHINSKTKNDYLITIDLQDFFWHILDSHVKKVITSYYWKETLDYKWDMITKYICYKNKLPIWALTSPFISNLVWYHYIDIHILEMLKFENLFKYGINWKMAGIYYTRYSDDLVFSCNRNTNKTLLIKDIINHLIEIWFPVNFSKFRIQSKNWVQSINWININSWNPTIKKSKREDLYFYTKLFIKNPDDAIKKWNNKKWEDISEKNKFYQKLVGLNSYYLHVMKDNKKLDNNLKILKNNEK